MKKTTLAYGIIFGRSPLLSLAELENFLARQKMAVEWLAAGKQGALLRGLKITDPQGFLNQLGGSVRIVEVLDRISLAERTDFNKPLTEALQADIMTRDYLGETDKNKITFGFSAFYLEDTPKKLQRDVTLFLRQRARKIKQDLKSRNRSSRFVQTIKMDASLSSVQLRKQGVFNKNGVEWCLMFAGTEVYLSRTVAVQDFEAYAARDYARPHRDPKVGMLPPKIAQIMLNLAQQPAGAHILDPYCGLGTVIQEALLLGYQAHGSDLDKTLAQYTMKNLEWFQKTTDRDFTDKYAIAVGDARKISAKLRKASIDAVVTESSLGPSYSKIPSPGNMTENFDKLNRLHSQTLHGLKAVLKTHGTVVLVLPFYRNPRQPQEIELFPWLDNLLENGYSIRQPLTEDLQRISGLKPTERGTLLYARPQQFVGREIVILEKTS